MSEKTYAVIFSSQRSDVEKNEYELMAEEMVNLAGKHPGFISVESVRGNDGFGITISYWKSLEAIQSWKQNSRHLIAQKSGTEKWYESFRIRICEIQREYGFGDMK